jgi:hypothetical protein
MADATIDTSATLEIRNNPWKQLLYVIGAAAFVAVGWFMTQATPSTSRQSAETIRLFGWLSIAFFGFCLLVLAWRLLTQHGPVITLTPAGFHDIRVTHDVVRWSAVQSIGTWQRQGSKVMVVALKPGEEEKLRLTTIARMSRGANARLGADGLAITAQGTTVDHETLMRTAVAYAERHGAGGA